MTRDPRTVMQFLGNWSAHVKSWTRARDFPVLAAQEQAAGFREKGGAQARFFRRGVSGQWRDGLAGDIVERIAADHGAVMKRHGYLAR